MGVDRGIVTYQTWRPTVWGGVGGGGGGGGGGDGDRHNTPYIVASVRWRAWYNSR